MMRKKGTSTDEKDEDDDSGSSDDEHDVSKPVTVAHSILQKAMERIQHLPQAELFKYSGRNTKPVTSNSEATPAKADNGCHMRQGLQDQRGLMQHHATHR